jgi:hypothetical protein
VEIIITRIIISMENFTCHWYWKQCHNFSHCLCIKNLPLRIHHLCQSSTQQTFLLRIISIHCECLDAHLSFLSVYWIVAMFRGCDIFVLTLITHPIGQCESFIISVSLSSKNWIDF